jgi:hypothetical protein
MRAGSFNEFLGAGEKRLWNCEIKRLGRSLIDYQFKFCWLLDRKIGRLRAVRECDLHNKLGIGTIPQRGAR